MPTAIAEADAYLLEAALRHPLLRELALPLLELAGAACDAGDPEAPLARCAGCDKPWTDQDGPHAMVLGAIDGVDELAGALLCAPCVTGPGRQAAVERVLRGMLPENARDVRRVDGQPGSSAHH